MRNERIPLSEYHEGEPYNLRRLQSDLEIINSSRDSDFFPSHILDALQTVSHRIDSGDFQVPWESVDDVMSSIASEMRTMIRFEPDGFKDFGVFRSFLGEMILPHIYAVAIKLHEASLPMFGKSDHQYLFADLRDKVMNVARKTGLEAEQFGNEKVLSDTLPERLGFLLNTRVIDSYAVADASLAAATLHHLTKNEDGEQKQTCFPQDGRYFPLLQALPIAFSQSGDIGYSFIHHGVNNSPLRNYFPIPKRGVVPEDKSALN